LGFCGGHTGAAIAEDLAEAGIPHRLVAIAGESRRTVAIQLHDSTDLTELLEPGPVISPSEWEAFVQEFSTAVTTAQVVVLSGSIPPGVPDDAYALLIRAARAAGVATILDSSGAALAAGLAAGPDIVKPNRDELQSLLTEPLRDGVAAVAAAAHTVRARFGDVSVVVSLGADGLVAAVDDDLTLEGRAPIITGNHVGAGDAAVAGLAEATAQGADWAARLRLAATLGAAAVAHPVAGGYDAATANSISSDVVVRSRNR
jgi:tagatose 6-phosphate kinase